MLYRINTGNYGNFEIFEENTLPARSYFIPFSNREKCENAHYIQSRYQSDRVTPLRGDWEFFFFEKTGAIPKVFDTAKAGFVPITVPSCWQMLGFENPMYVNCRFPFKSKPPVIPEKGSVGTYFNKSNGGRINGRDAYNTAGLYRKVIDVKSISHTFYISFLGVSSAFDLFINGNYAGYAEGAHNTKEFDISKFLMRGENEIVVVVYKWSNGSYLECQDMFRHAGIFRDVLLYSCLERHIYDLNFNTSFKGGNGCGVNIGVTVKNPSDCFVTISLEGKDFRYSETKAASAVTDFEFFAPSVTQYNPESPYLYDLYVTLGDGERSLECIRKRVGFRNVEIKDGVFYYNGTAVKFKGVNHHDTHPRGGFTMSYDDMLKDVTVMKEFNVNCVRTSHYPPDPMFIDLCDEYGLYVIAEADIETHGLVNNRKISNDLKWKDRYWSRIYRMYSALKNSPSVCMWSLGNESGGWLCQDYCYENLKKISTLPVHYEGVIHTPRVHYDVLSCMYPSLTQLRSYLNNGARGKKIDVPIFMCEYAHAMGTGAGNLQEYWDIIESSDRYLGGCIWEFCDHAVYHPDGVYKYTYGGDHGEYIHDNNFCVDGLFTPERKPHTGAFNMRYVYRPVRSRLVNNDTIELFNTNYFADTSDIAVILTVIEDGKEKSSTQIMAVLSPREKRRFNIFTGSAQNDLFLNVKYVNCRTNKLITTEQHIISERIPEVEISGQRLSVNKTADALTVNFDGGFIKFDKFTGNAVNYVVDGTDYLKSDPKRIGTKCFATNIERPDMDNDRRLKKNFLRNVKMVLRDMDFEVKRDKTGTPVSAEVVISHNIYDGGKCVCVSEDSFVINPGGRVDVHAVLYRKSLKKELRCYGKIFKLAPEFNEVIYYGRGGGENYPDIKAHAPIGIYTKKAFEFGGNEIKPQESGNRCDTRYALVKNISGRGIMFLAQKEPFNLNVKQHSAVQIDAAGHTEDLPAPDCVYVHIDAEVRGCGSASCGPDTLPEYRIQQKNKHEFFFSVIPFTCVDDRVMRGVGKS